MLQGNEISVTHFDTLHLILLISRFVAMFLFLATTNTNYEAGQAATECMQLLIELLMSTYWCKSALFVIQNMRSDISFQTIAITNSESKSLTRFFNDQFKSKFNDKSNGFFNRNFFVYWTPIWILLCTLFRSCTTCLTNIYRQNWSRKM